MWVSDANQSGVFSTTKIELNSTFSNMGYIEYRDFEKNIFEDSSYGTIMFDNLDDSNTYMGLVKLQNTSISILETHLAMKP